MESTVSVRPLRLEDIARLHEIDTGFVSDAVLQVDKLVQGLGVVWTVHEVALASPLGKPNGYDLVSEDLALVRRRLEEGHSLQLLAEHAGRPVGLIDAEHQAWNQTSMVWNILIDRHHRRRGLGRHFMQRAAEWARQHGCRALTLETQNNNIDACRFYQHLGFRLTGIRDDLYHNDDLQRGEVAIFWSLAVDASTGDRGVNGV